jgi:hypothetical protein
MKKSSAILALATTLISGAALADSGTSTATATAVAPSVMSKITASYVGLYHGPGIKDPISSMQPDENGELSGQMLESSIIGGYKLTNTITAGAYVNFTSEVGKGTYLNDPALNIANSKMIDMGNFSMASHFRAYLPVTQASRDANQITQLRNLNILNYDVPKTKLSLGLITSERLYIYSSNTDGQRVARLYAGPMVNYQLTPTIAVGVLGEVESTYKRGADFFSVADGAFDVEPNISWDVTPKINVNPYLNLYPTKFSADSSSVGILLSAKIL